MTILSWDSNPVAYGAMHMRMEGRKASIGGISSLPSGKVKGYLLGELVYEGECETTAMRRVEQKFSLLPAGVVSALKD